eukprot:TRINITY_DN1583_c0_g1_i1.p1 TRINITY_DN1583_c0_g1~~TRINITY_DN1583_c0_g1_i1.p1  ORF type:complete len:1256 (-),score=289.37 TRINITY_DN1583_c0_g1_i1:186-3953(-)
MKLLVFYLCIFMFCIEVYSVESIEPNNEVILEVDTSYSREQQRCFYFHEAELDQIVTIHFYSIDFVESDVNFWLKPAGDTSFDAKHRFIFKKARKNEIILQKNVTLSTDSPQYFAIGLKASLPRDSEVTSIKIKLLFNYTFTSKKEYNANLLNIFPAIDNNDCYFFDYRWMLNNEGEFDENRLFFFNLEDRKYDYVSLISTTKNINSKSNTDDDSVFKFKMIECQNLDNATEFFQGYSEFFKFYFFKSVERFVCSIVGEEQLSVIKDNNPLTIDSDDFDNFLVYVEKNGIDGDKKVINFTLPHESITTLQASFNVFVVDHSKMAEIDMIPFIFINYAYDLREGFIQQNRTSSYIGTLYPILSLKNGFSIHLKENRVFPDTVVLLFVREVNAFLSKAIYSNEYKQLNFDILHATGKELFFHNCVRPLTIILNSQYSVYLEIYRQPTDMDLSNEFGSATISAKPLESLKQPYNNYVAKTPSFARFFFSSEVFANITIEQFLMINIRYFPLVDHPDELISLYCGFNQSFSPECVSGELYPFPDFSTWQAVVPDELRNVSMIDDTFLEVNSYSNWTISQSSCASWEAFMKPTQLLSGIFIVSRSYNLSLNYSLHIDGDFMFVEGEIFLKEPGFAIPVPIIQENGLGNSISFEKSTGAYDVFFALSNKEGSSITIDNSRGSFLVFGERSGSVPFNFGAISNTHYTLMKLNFTGQDTNVISDVYLRFFQGTVESVFFFSMADVLFFPVVDFKFDLALYLSANKSIFIDYEFFNPTFIRLFSEEDDSICDITKYSYALFKQDFTNHECVVQLNGYVNVDVGEEDYESKFLYLDFFGLNEPIILVNGLIERYIDNAQTFSRFYSTSLSPLISFRPSNGVEFVDGLFFTVKIVDLLERKQFDNQTSYRAGVNATHVRFINSKYVRMRQHHFNAESRAKLIITIFNFGMYLFPQQSPLLLSLNNVSSINFTTIIDEESAKTSDHIIFIDEIDDDHFWYGKKWPGKDPVTIACPGGFWKANRECHLPFSSGVFSYNSHGVVTVNELFLGLNMNDTLTLRFTDIKPRRILSVLRPNYTESDELEFFMFKEFVITFKNVFKEIKLKVSSVPMTFIVASYENVTIEIIAPSDVNFRALLILQEAPENEDSFESFFVEDDPSAKTKFCSPINWEECDGAELMYADFWEYFEAHWLLVIFLGILGLIVLFSVFTCILWLFTRNKSITQDDEEYLFKTDIQELIETQETDQVHSNFAVNFDYSELDNTELFL